MSLSASRSHRISAQPATNLQFVCQFSQSGPVKKSDALRNIKILIRNFKIFGAFRREVCGESPIIDKWMYALKNLSRLEERPAALRERVFARLFRDEGRAEGHAAGLAEGEARGRAEGKAEVARNLLASGMAADQVSAFTGLTAEQLAPQSVSLTGRTDTAWL